MLERCLGYSTGGGGGGISASWALFTAVTVQVIYKLLSLDAGAMSGLQAHSTGGYEAPPRI